MKYLFIGGHNDGRRVDLQDPLRIIVLPIKEKASLGICDKSSDYKTEAFKAIPFEANGGTFIVYALCGMSAYQVLHTLIERYPTPKQPEPMKLKYQSKYDAINNRRTP